MWKVVVLSILLAGCTPPDSKGIELVIKNVMQNMDKLQCPIKWVVRLIH